MADMKHIIEPERQGIWTAAAFIIALLALVLALLGLKNSRDMMYMTQTEILLLNKKIENAKASGNAPAVAVPEAPAAPAASEASAQPQEQK